MVHNVYGRGRDDTEIEELQLIKESSFFLARKVSAPWFFLTSSVCLLFSPLFFSLTLSPSSTRAEGNLYAWLQPCLVLF